MYLSAAIVTEGWEQKELLSIASLNNGLIGYYKWQITVSLLIFSDY